VSECIYIYIYINGGAMLYYGYTYMIFKTQFLKSNIPYFPAHKTHRDFFVSNFRKK